MWPQGSPGNGPQRRPSHPQPGAPRGKLGERTCGRSAAQRSKFAPPKSSPRVPDPPRPVVRGTLRVKHRLQHLPTTGRGVTHFLQTSQATEAASGARPGVRVAPHALRLEGRVAEEAQLC